MTQQFLGTSYKSTFRLMPSSRFGFIVGIDCLLTTFIRNGRTCSRSLLSSCSIYVTRPTFATSRIIWTSTSHIHRKDPCRCQSRHSLASLAQVTSASRAERGTQSLQKRSSVSLARCHSVSKADMRGSMNPNFNFYRILDTWPVNWDVLGVPGASSSLRTSK